MTRLLARKSGTADLPTPQDLVRQALVDLADTGDGGWLTFEARRIKGLVEIAYQKEYILVNILHRFRDDYQAVFAQHNLLIPDGWQVRDFKKRRGLDLATTLSDGERVAAFVADIFSSLYEAPQDYQLYMTLQE